MKKNWSSNKVNLRIFVIIENLSSIYLYPFLTPQFFVVGLDRGDI